MRSISPYEKRDARRPAHAMRCACACTARLRLRRAARFGHGCVTARGVLLSWVHEQPNRHHRFRRHLRRRRCRTRQHWCRRCRHRHRAALAAAVGHCVRGNRHGRVRGGGGVSGVRERLLPRRQRGAGQPDPDRRGSRRTGRALPSRSATPRRRRASCSTPARRWSTLPTPRSCATWRNGAIWAVVVEMPFNFAFFDIAAADGVRAAYPQVERWWVGGHSLGGSMAAQYAADHADDAALAGLALLGAYSASDLSACDLDAVVVYGQNDQVLDRSKLEDNAPVASRGRACRGNSRRQPCGLRRLRTAGRRRRSRHRAAGTTGAGSRRPRLPHGPSSLAPQAFLAHAGRPE